MGNRALIVFHDGREWSPSVYLHWGASALPDLLAATRKRMESRGGDLSYTVARCIGLAHEQTPGNLSLGASLHKVPAQAIGSPRELTAWEDYCPGDAGVFVVDVRTWRVRRTLNNQGECEAPMEWIAGEPFPVGSLGNALAAQKTEPLVPKIHTPTERPTLAQAQALVGGLVQLLELKGGDQLLVNEEGRCHAMPPNVAATMRWPEWGDLVGPVVYLTGAARWTD